MYRARRSRAGMFPRRPISAPRIGTRWRSMSASTRPTAWTPDGSFPCWPATQMSTAPARTSPARPISRSSSGAPVREGDRLGVRAVFGVYNSSLASATRSYSSVR